jgi:hypothetical protein
VFPNIRGTRHFDGGTFAIAVPRRVFIARFESVSRDIASMSYLCAAPVGGVKPLAHQRLSSRLDFEGGMGVIEESEKKLFGRCV